MEKIKITSWNRKSRKEIQHREEISQNGRYKSSGTYTDLSNRIFIIGDTIVKQVKDHKLWRKVENCKYFVKSFLGANVMCMEDYERPTLKEMPTHIILHIVTNYVSTKKDPDQIAENIVNLAIKLKRNCHVSISGMTARNDQ